LASWQACGDPQAIEALIASARMECSMCISTGWFQRS
jgi:hypothetical protein